VKYEKELFGTLGLKGHLQKTKTRKSQVRNWLLIILIWIVTVGIQAITSFLVTGLLGMVLGIALSAIPFFLGFRAVKTVIEKETWYS
jgi:polyferredoxin